MLGNVIEQFVIWDAAHVFSSHTIALSEKQTLLTTVTKSLSQKVQFSITRSSFELFIYSSLLDSNMVKIIQTFYNYIDSYSMCFLFFF